jgi:hypothetical protein
MRSPTNFEDALREIERLRGELRACLRELHKGSYETKESQEFNDKLMLYGDSRKGHEFDVI